MKGYTVIVAEDDSKDSSLLDMLRWKEVQSYNDWPPYQVPWIISFISNFSSIFIST